MNQRQKKLCPETGKKKFPTRLHAEVRILDIEREAGHPLYSYRCEHCHWWHITKSFNFETLVHLHLNSTP